MVLVLAIQLQPLQWEVVLGLYVDQMAVSETVSSYKNLGLTIIYNTHNKVQELTPEFCSGIFITAIVLRKSFIYFEIHFYFQWQRSFIQRHAALRDLNRVLLLWDKF